MLLSNRGIHPLPHLLSDLLELSHQAFDLRFALDHELAASGLPAVVRKAHGWRKRRGPPLAGLRARYRRLRSRVGIRTLHEGLGKRFEEREEDIHRKSAQERHCERRYRGGLSRR